MFDSVYTPRKTRLLKEAEAAGAIVVSGVEMFLRQAMGQFNLFTGKEGGPSFCYYKVHNYASKDTAISNVSYLFLQHQLTSCAKLLWRNSDV